MALKMYGIKNCDTVKKAQIWLEGRSLGFAFHDYKVSGMDEARLRQWASQVGWEKLLNRSGTTFRKLPETEKSDLNESKALALMMAQPSMIKRPVLETGNGLLVGFDPERYAAAFSGADRVG